MSQDGIERLHYYQRQYLGALDFADEQSYQRDMRRRHNLAHHRWGIVTGLKLVESEVKDGPDTLLQVQIQPGMAIDGYGREIVVFTPYTLSSEQFMGYLTPRYCAVYIEYDETLVTNAQAAYQQCNASGQYNRINETFRVLIDVDQRTQYGNIIVDNKVQTVDTDEYMAVQEFPDPLGARPHWRILLGRVLWDGQKFSPSKFLTDGRRYVGNVTAEIITPSPSLLVHRQHLPTNPSVPEADAPPPLPPMEMIIQGKLTVDQLLTAQADIQLQGGMLDFYDGSLATDPTNVGMGSGLPQRGTFSLAYVQRADDEKGGKDLRIQIGAESSEANHFTVRAGTTDLLTVQGNGDAQLAVGSLTLQNDLNLAGKLNLGKVQLVNSKNDQGGTDTRLQIGASGNANDRFLIAGAATNGTGKALPSFTVTAAGKVSFGGTLELTNNLSIGNDLSIGGALTTQGDLKVSGSGIFSQGLHAQGDATVEQNLSVAGSATVQQNLNVGGALVIGSLTLQRDFNLAGKLNLGNAQLASSKNEQGGIDTHLQIGASGNTHDRFLIAGTAKNRAGQVLPLFTVTAAGNVSFGGTFELPNNLSISNDLSVGGALTTQGDLKVSGSGIFSRGLHTQGNATVEQNLGVTGSATVQQNLSVTGSATVQQNLNVGGALAVKGAFTAGSLEIVGKANLQKGMNVKGPLTVGANAEVTGEVHLRNNLRVDGALFTYGGLSVADGCLSRLFTMEETVSAGDVVVLSRDTPGAVKLTNTAHDRSVLGVVSTTATFILDGPPGERTEKKRIAVALMGVVECKVDADVAPIRVGDLLTTSKTPGHAQRLVVNLADAIGTILGKAIGRLDRGKGVVQIQLCLS